MSDDRFAHDSFFVDQLIRPIANLYRISTLGSDGASPGEPVAFVRQKKLAIREDIRFFADEREQEELFRIKARQIFEVGGRYDVTTRTGERIGILEKVFGISLLRSPSTAARSASCGGRSASVIATSSSFPVTPTGASTAGWPSPSPSRWTPCKAASSPFRAITRPRLGIYFRYVTNMNDRTV